MVNWEPIILICLVVLIGTASYIGSRPVIIQTDFNITNRTMNNETINIIELKFECIKFCSEQFRGDSDNLVYCYKECNKLG